MSKPRAATSVAINNPLGFFSKLNENISYKHHINMLKSSIIYYNEIWMCK